MAKNPMLSGLRLPTAASTPLADSFPKWCPRALHFISECLNLTPSRRPNADGLIKHEYFTHDSFPEKFLPELKKKVQEEFNSNSLSQVSTSRKDSGRTEKPKNAKINSPENISSKNGTKFLQQFTAR